MNGDVKDDGAAFEGRRWRGFTLIEVMVAVALLSAVLVALYSSFFTTLDARSRIEGELERTAEAARFLEIFSREVKSAYYSDSNPKTAFRGTSGHSDGRPVSSLAMTSFTYPAFAGGRSSGDLAAVRYTVSGEAGRLTLYKETWNPYAPDNASPLKAEVMEDIEGFEIGYYNGKDWAKAWDAKAERRAPEAVRATLSVKDRGAVRGFSTLAKVMVR